MKDETVWFAQLQMTKLFKVKQKKSIEMLKIVMIYLII